MSDLWRRNRVGIVLTGSLLLVLGLLALVVGGNPRGNLDPDGYAPDGGHALATLLRDRGVTVTRTTDVPSTVAAADGATVFVPEPQLLSEEELALIAGSPARVVVAQADPGTLTALGDPAEVSGARSTSVRSPGCRLPIATNAGRVRAGGLAYRTSQTGSSGCYDGTLLEVPASKLVLLGSPGLLTNAHLDEQGDAALGIGLLGATGRVVWLMPSPTREAIGARPISSPDELLPTWVPSARRGLLLALVVLALWRARRLGRVVLEDLPVVVRAAETVEGHGRLYHAAGARGTAADALRRSALRSLARLTHGGEPPSPESLTALVAERSGRDGASVRALLYGPPPVDDAALVRLASELDTLTRDALVR